MTIAKRLIILLVVPLLAFAGLGIFNWVQVTNVENSSRFVSETADSQPRSARKSDAELCGFAGGGAESFAGDQRNGPRTGRAGI